MGEEATLNQGKSPLFSDTCHVRFIKDDTKHQVILQKAVNQTLRFRVVYPQAAIAITHNWGLHAIIINSELSPHHKQIHRC